MMKFPKIFFCVSLLFLIINPLFSGINFSNRKSKVSINNSASFVNSSGNSISSWSGTLENKTGGSVSGSPINFSDGILDESETENRLTGIYQPNEINKIFLDGSKIFRSSVGASLNKINVFGSGNRIEGQPIFSNTDSIRLEHQNTNLTIAVQSNLNSDIELRGGKVNLDNDLKFTEDRIFTGSGTVDLQGYGLYFGGKRDFNITHTIDWQNSTDINLTGKTDLSGRWVFDGPAIVNGHGNILDMSTGGEFYFGHQASLELTDIVLRGIGADKGWIIFQDNTSTLSASNVHFDFDTDFTMTVGKMYVDGPTTISGFFSSSRTIDLQNDLFLSGNMTLSCGQGISGNGNTINLLGNLNIQENTPLHFMSDTLVEGNGNTIVLQDNAQLFVDTDVSVTLRNVKIKNSKNFFSDAPIRLAATTSRLALDNAKLSFVDDFYFDRGRIYFYNDVEFTGTNSFIYRSTVPSYIKSGANLKFSPDSIFDFRPSTTGEPGLLAKNLLIMDDESAKITFDGCTLKSTFTGFNLTKGSVFFDNKVSITSASQLKILDYTQTITQYHTIDRSNIVDQTADGRYWAVGCNNAGEDVLVLKFDGTNLEKITSVNFNSMVVELQWSPDGKYLAVGSIGTPKFSVYKFEHEALTQVGSVLNFGGGGDYARGIAWSPDCKYIAVGATVSVATTQAFYLISFDGSDLTTVAAPSEFQGFDVKDIDWHPSGKYLTIAGNDNEDIGDLLLYSFNGVSLDSVTSVSFGSSNTVASRWSSDGRFLAIGGTLQDPFHDDLQIFYFDIANEKLDLITTADPFDSGVKNADWSADGRYLVVGGSDSSGSDYILYEFNGSSLNLIGSGLNLADDIWSVKFSKDQNFLFTTLKNPVPPYQEIQIFRVDYGPETQTQSIYNSIVFGNSELGSDYDVNLKLLSDAYVEVDGMLNYDNTLGLTPFSNDDAKFVLKDSNSYIRLNPVNVFGWKDRSLLRNSLGAGIGDYNLLTYDLDANDIISYAEAPADFIYNNSNAIVNLEPKVENNSNAILHLEDPVENNSNAIVTVENQVESNSNAIMWQDIQIKDNSNAVKNVEEQIKENSNAIKYSEVEIKDNSNAIKYLEIQIKDNSNAVDNITPFVRWNSNAIESEADMEIFVRTNSNAILNLEEQIKENSNAIVRQDDQIRFNSNAIASVAAESDYIRWNSNAIVSAIKIYDTYQTYENDTTLENLVLYKKGFLIKPGKALTLNTPLPMGGHLDLLGTLSFASNLYLDSGVTFSTSGHIYGNDYALHMGSNITISQNQILYFNGNTIVEGHGNTILLEDNAQLFVDTDVSVTFRNVNVKNINNSSASPALKCSANTSQLTLDNVKLNFVDDFYFDDGQLYFYNEVDFTGTNKFIYRSTASSFIASGANLLFDTGTTFSYDTATASSHLINMVDESSSLYLKGCTLQCTTTGLNLTKGRLFLDNKVLLKSNSGSAINNSIVFGNSTLGSAYDLNIKLLSGAFVEVDGILNIDNTLTTSIFDNDVSKFVLKDSNSKIKFASSNVNGFSYRSIMKQTEDRGFGDYNLLNYDTNADDIISYSEAPADLLISNSNAIVNNENEIKDNSNAIISLNTFFVDDIKNNSNTIVSLEAGRIGKFISVNDGILSAIGAINSETTIQGRGILSSPINLNGATLTNGGDILFSSGTTIESSGNLNPIGHAYILGGDINLPENVDLKFTTSGIIDGQGHSWTFGHNSKIRFDEYVTVTLRNIKLNNVRNHSDGNASITVLNPWRSKLVLQNSEINLADTFSFTSGELFLHGDVKICGTTQFNYTSTSFARIVNASQLYFDQGVTFSYGPSITDNRDLINMEDATSAIYLNGCTLKSTTTGLRLKTGKLIIDGKVIVYNQDDKNGVATSLSQAISFGDGVSDLDVEIMPAANIEMMSGILDVN